MEPFYELLPGVPKSSCGERAVVGQLMEGRVNRQNYLHWSFSLSACPPTLAPAFTFYGRALYKMVFDFSIKLYIYSFKKLICHHFTLFCKKDNDFKMFLYQLKNLGKAQLGEGATYEGFPGGSVAKNPPANAGDAGDTGSIPGSGSSPGGGNGNPFPSSCLENPTHRGAEQATYSPWGWRGWTRLND